MAEETQEKQEVKIPAKKGWFQRIPASVILSPGGVILIFLAAVIELIDLIPLPIIDQVWEIPLELLFIVFFIIIVKPSFRSLIIPFIIERIPFISDFIPTWFLKMIM